MLIPNSLKEPILISCCGKVICLHPASINSNLFLVLFFSTLAISSPEFSWEDRNSFRYHYRVRNSFLI